MTVRPIDLQSNPPSVRVFESTLFLHSKEDCPFLSRVLMGGRLFEPFETHLLRREIRPGDVVLDIGANIGYYTIQFAHLVGARGKVVAFEPDSVNFNLLEQSVKANRLSNIELVNAAISDRRGRHVLHRSRKNPGDHQLFDSGEDRETIEVEVTTLDEFFVGRNPRVDFIKMDIQGSELHALNGAKGLLSANPFVKLTCEFWPAGLQKAGADPRELLLQLRRLGFCALEIDETNGQLLPLRPRKLLEELAQKRPNFTNLYCIKTSSHGRDVAARIDQETWKIWRSPQDLRLFERKVYSQNGEDGILEEIVRRIGTGSNTFVEFGTGNGKVCNCALLAQEKGWSGIFMEADKSKFEGLQSTYAAFSNVKTICAKVTSRNVESLFAEARVPPELDILSIDIDGNDYWVWKAITSWRPRIVVIEMNGQKPPPLDWVMPEDIDHVWSGTDYYGASLASLRDLGRKKGYVLVGSESRGVYAFFVRSDLVLDSKFVDPELAYHYSPPNYGPHHGGHPPDERTVGS